jgi:hypothetical protein
MSANSVSAEAGASDSAMREVQMPELCSVRQLAGLLGVELQQLEGVLKEQLGEEIKSGRSLSTASKCTEPTCFASQRSHACIASRLVLLLYGWLKQLSSALRFWMTCVWRFALASRSALVTMLLS